MNTHDLVAFVAVVETGSIVAASARLNLTQPGVTRRIQNLEEMLGAQLLDRLSKPLKPTAAGIEAYEQGRRLLRMLDDLKSGVANDGAVRGEFRLGLTPFLSEAGLTASARRGARRISGAGGARRLGLVAQPHGAGQPQRARRGGDLPS
ncbi:DNA-binding transcriptional LysR family regulator [Bradyrhizobium elkanii]